MTNLYAFMPSGSHYVNTNRIYGSKPRIFNQSQDHALLSLRYAIDRFLLRNSNTSSDTLKLSNPPND